MRALQPAFPAPAAAAAAGEPILTLSGIDKNFPGVRALQDVSLALYPGSVTALIGENGAGKSTLVKILTGIYPPSRGRIRLGGAPIVFRSPQAAARAGIAAIHQETVLFDALSVCENIFIGQHRRNRLGLIDWPAMRRDAGVVLSELGCPLDPDCRLADLGIAQKHMVAIARALAADARIVVMDEPTAALSHKEIEEIFAIVERLKAEGRAILFISHKFDEVFRLADRYSVFRDGRMVGAGMIAETSEAELVRLMVGRTVDQIFPKQPITLGETVLKVSRYCHPTEFDDISFDLRRGEILGVYGLIGSGRSEVMQALFGITRPSAGRLEIEGRSVIPDRPGTAIKHGIVYVPEERGRQGAVLALPVYQNISLPSLSATSRHGFLRLAHEFRLARDYARRLQLKARSLSQPVRDLSGGNQQKVVIGKWLATRPRVIILDEPTKGVDIGSKAAVHAFMSDLVAQGMSIIMVSSELPEILGMSDRILVMRAGRIAGRVDRATASPEILLRLATGNAPSSPPHTAPSPCPPHPQ